MNQSTIKKRIASKTICIFGAVLLTFTLYFIFSISGVLYAFTDNITVAVVPISASIILPDYQGAESSFADG